MFEMDHSICVAVVADAGGISNEADGIADCGDCVVRRIDGDGARERHFESAEGCCGNDA
jgi:hypothetical protein